MLVFSPEVLIFLFFMITDPKTTPPGAGQRRVYAVAVALLAVLLIAPTTTEFWTKVALLGALDDRLRVAAGGRAARPAVRADVHGAAAARSRRGGGRRRGRRSPACSCSPAFPPGRAPRSPAPTATGELPPATILPSKGVATQIEAATARQITADLVTDLRLEAEALRKRDKAVAATAAGGERLQGLWQQIGLASNRALDRPGAPRREPRSSTSNRPSARSPPLVDRHGHGHRAARHGRGQPADRRLHRATGRRSPERSSFSSIAAAT